MNCRTVNLMCAVLAMPAGAAADDAAALAKQARAILQTHCAGCHGGGKGAAKGGFGFVLDHDRLLGRSLIVPGKARESELYLRVEQGDMPPPAKKVRPSAAEQKILQRWLDTGASSWDEGGRAAKVLSEREAAQAVVADLKRTDQRRRRFTRYLTLNHLAAARRTDMAGVREAAGKLLNSLSWHPRISLPLPVDADATILRIDLRDYKWTAGLWAKLAVAYPYRLGTWLGAAREFAALSGTETPALRADWFIANASRPPLYHDLLQIPPTDRALERLLQVDVPGNLQDDNVMRAGFNDSGVSKNNRLIERHDGAHGALWRSHDFAGNLGRQNLFEHPLGPNTGATSFQPAGGEIIFHLPNGLLGFMLVDASGRRIDKAPGEIVADPRRPDQRVETGISCMSCHARGILPKADQVRAHVDRNVAVFGRNVVDTVRALHAGKAVFQAQVERDNERYRKALESFGVRDPDQEPINLVTQRFEATLDGRTAAAELGMSPGQMASFLKRQPDMARIFGGLLTAGGTVQRETFQESFPELARRLLADDARATTIAADAAFKGHQGTVNAVTFSADGKRAASAGDDRLICIWEIPSGKVLARLQGSGGAIDALAFSPDGKFLLSAGQDRLVRLWDVQQHQLSRVFRGHTDRVRCVAFAPDGKRAVSGGDDNSVRVWKVSDGSELAALAGHGKAITGVAWSGGNVLSGSLDGTLRLWDWKESKQRRVLEGHAGAVLSVALSADGALALSGGNDKSVRLWRVSDGVEVVCFKGHANAVVHVQFAAEGKHVLSSSSQHRGTDRVWRRWDPKGGEVGSLAPAEEARIGCAAFTGDGRYVLAGGPGGFLRLWSWSP